MKVDDLKYGDRVMFKGDWNAGIGVFKKKIDIEALAEPSTILLCQFYKEPYLRACFPKYIIAVDELDV